MFFLTWCWVSQWVYRLKCARTGDVNDILFSDLLSQMTHKSFLYRSCTQTEQPKVRDTVVSLCAAWNPWQFPESDKAKNPCVLFSSYHCFLRSSFPVVSLLWSVPISEWWWGCLTSQDQSRKCYGYFTRTILGEKFWTLHQIPNSRFRPLDCNILPSVILWWERLRVGAWLMLRAGNNGTKCH